MKESRVEHNFVSGRVEKSDCKRPPVRSHSLPTSQEVLIIVTINSGVMRLFVKQVPQTQNHPRKVKIALGPRSFPNP